MIINKQLIIHPGEKMSLQEQHKVLERIFVEQLKPIKWLTITDKFRKDIPMKVRNMKFENFKKEFVVTPEDESVLALVFEFDIHYQTEKQEATHHVMTRWVCPDYSNHAYDIRTIGTWIQTNIINTIRKQLIFTDKIDKNLFKYYKCEENGWVIIKS